jgi:anthranilate synthase component 1
VEESHSGGAVGFISYDCVRYFEPTTQRDIKDTLQIPDAIMMLCDSVIVFDHLHNQTLIVTNVFTQGARN